MIQVFRFDKSLSLVGVVDDCSYIVVVENVINREVEVVKHVATQLGCGWALSKEVGNCFFCHFATGTEVGVGSFDCVEVFVESAVP